MHADTFDVHLMINKPLRFIKDFADAGANIITFHTEAGSPVYETIEKIRGFGCVPSLCVRPSTSVEEVFPYLDIIGMVLIMTVEPGFGGQPFMADMTAKIAALRRECKSAESLWISRWTAASTPKRRRWPRQAART